jgi:hypothetical protein
VKIQKQGRNLFREYLKLKKHVQNDTGQRGEQLPRVCALLSDDNMQRSAYYKPYATISLLQAIRY